MCCLSISCCHAGSCVKTLKLPLKKVKSILRTADLVHGGVGGGYLYSFPVYHVPVTVWVCRSWSHPRRKPSTSMEDWTLDAPSPHQEAVAHPRRNDLCHILSICCFCNVFVSGRCKCFVHCLSSQFLFVGHFCHVMLFVLFLIELYPRGFVCVRNKGHEQSDISLCVTHPVSALSRVACFTW